MAEEARASGGGIHHRFAVSDGFVLVVDEWESAERFQKFFANPDLQALIARSGAAPQPPEITVAEAISTPASTKRTAMSADANIKTIAEISQKRRQPGDRLRHAPHPPVRGPSTAGDRGRAADVAVHDDRALVSGRIDVAITCGLIPAPEGVANEVFCAEPLLVGLRPDHRLAGRDTVALRDLAHDVLGMPPEDLFPAWTLAQRQALEWPASARPWLSSPTPTSPPFAGRTKRTPSGFCSLRPWRPRTRRPWSGPSRPATGPVHLAVEDRAHTAAVARFVYAALTADLPPGWRTQPGHLHHRE